jgi:predicted alpha/beta-hydrolase family hydrolase
MDRRTSGRQARSLTVLAHQWTRRSWISSKNLGERGFRAVRFEYSYMVQKRHTGKQKPPDRAPVLVLGGMQVFFPWAASLTAVVRWKHDESRWVRQKKLAKCVAAG